METGETGPGKEAIEFKMRGEVSQKIEKFSRETYNNLEEKKEKICVINGMELDKLEGAINTKQSQFEEFKAQFPEFSHNATEMAFNPDAFIFKNSNFKTQLEQERMINEENQKLNNNKKDYRYKEPEAPELLELMMFNLYKRGEEPFKDKEFFVRTATPDANNPNYTWVIGKTDKKDPRLTLFTAPKNFKSSEIHSARIIVPTIKNLS